MKRFGAGLAALCVGAALAGSAPAQPENAFEYAAPAKTPQAVIASWPKPAQAVARAMIEEYGLPHRYDDRALVWTNNGPWRRTVVRRASRPDAHGADVLEQTVRYAVPADELVDLRRFDDRLKVDLAKGELTSRSESEALNFLALNLADELLKGTRTVESARDYYGRTERLARAGKSSQYLRGLLFKSPRP